MKEAITSLLVWMALWMLFGIILKICQALGLPLSEFARGAFTAILTWISHDYLLNNFTKKQ